jgi:hypothetical protein
MPIFAIWNRTAARTLMLLTRLEREAITDSVLKIQSSQASLDQIDEAKVLGMSEIHSCLRTAHKSLRVALRESSSGKPIRG